jgi:hypothetical protein
MTSDLPGEFNTVMFGETHYAPCNAPSLHSTFFAKSIPQVVTSLKRLPLF